MKSLTQVMANIIENEQITKHVEIALHSHLDYSKRASLLQSLYGSTKQIITQHELYGAQLEAILELTKALSL